MVFVGSQAFRTALWGVGAGTALSLLLAGAPLAARLHLAPQATPVISEQPKSEPAPDFAANPAAEFDQTEDGDPSVHAARLALYRERLSEFRKIEDRFFNTRRPPAHLLRRAVFSAAADHPGRTDLDCLSQAVYYEARGEPATGQAAVAQVVLNRVHDPRYPKSVCGVVYQGASHPGCQFSFACDGSMARGRHDAAAWDRARHVAEETLKGSAMPEVAGSTNYHANYVRPSWAQRLAKVAEIGRHIFYRAIGSVIPPGASPQPATGTAEAPLPAGSSPQPSGGIAAAL